MRFKLKDIIRDTCLMDGVAWTVMAWDTHRKMYVLERADLRQIISDSERYVDANYVLIGGPRFKNSLPTGIKPPEAIKYENEMQKDLAAMSTIKTGDTVSYTGQNPAYRGIQGEVTDTTPGYVYVDDKWIARDKVLRVGKNEEKKAKVNYKYCTCINPLLVNSSAMGNVFKYCKTCKLERV